MGRAAQARMAMELLGAPTVPPGGATVLLDRVRTVLRRGERRLAPPPALLLEDLLRVADGAVLATLVELGIPDALAGPRTTAELAHDCDAAVDPLDRVLRYAAHRGYVARRRGRFRPNATTRALRPDHPGSWEPWVRFATAPWVRQAWARLPDVVRGEATSGVEAAHGTSFFDHAHRVDPQAGEVFDQAMASGGRVHGLALAAALDWTGVDHVADLGGGTGATLTTLLDLVTGARGTVVDLPEVIARAPRHDRLAAVAADLFAPLPITADRCLLVAVLHDWDDGEAVEILRHAGASLQEGGDVVVVENVLPGAFATLTDVQMLVLSSGRERDEDAFVRLFALAGLRVRRQVVLATGARAFELVRS